MKTAAMTEIMKDKHRQAQAILRELNIDAWLVFVRESGEKAEPILPLLFQGSLTWQSAFIFTRSGDRVAVVGKYDDSTLSATGLWDQVIPYVQSIRPPLLEVFRRFDPKLIAVNYSTGDFSADGLSHGMYLLLQEYLARTPFADRLVSAERIVASLRGRKTESQVQRIRAAVTLTESILEEVAGYVRPGRTERQVAEFILEAARRRGVEPAWTSGQCPTVNSGPNSMVGHGVPSDLPIEPGHILHVDFGIKKDGYCSDLQRCWYVARPGEDSPPAKVRHAFEAVVEAISEAAAVLCAGVDGWQVDAAARAAMVRAGYPEYQHALGHHVGSSVHDGAGILGPRWERYGRTPFIKVEVGNVFTLEPSIVDAAGYGCLGLEEMVLLAPDGLQWLSHRQTTLPCLR